MSVDLTTEDRELLKRLLDEGRHIPERFRGSLFADSAPAELIWPGKTTRVTTAVLPFQSIEHLDEPRLESATIPSLFDLDTGSGRQVGGWTNKLIWGDNRLVLSSLANGPMRQEIEAAGGLKFVYIDPPFDVGADFSMDIDVGDSSVTKSPSVIEEVAYRDTWGEDGERYPQFMYERLRLIWELLDPDGVLCVHVDWRVVHYMRLMLDELFGRNRFVNELIWRYGKISKGTKRFAHSHDTLIVYSKSDRFTFNVQTSGVSEYRNRYERWLSDDNTLRYHAVRGSEDKLISQRVTKREKELGRNLTDEDVLFDFNEELKVADDVFMDISYVKGNSAERTAYPTQKPEALISRLVSAYTNEGDLVADFFAGSGTLVAVAEKSGRRWLATDLSRFAIHTCRKRLINIQRQRKSDNEPYRAFEVLNLGAYERQHFVGVDVNLPIEEQAEQTRLREEAYLGLILNAYAASRATSTPPFHGFRSATAVLVGPIDAPVTEKQVREAIASAVTARITRVDVLGFEFEMGLKPLLQDEARGQGVNLAIRYIPNDVFDTRAVKSGAVKFHDVAHVDFVPSVTGREVTVALTDFAVFYRQEDAEAAAAGLKNGASRVVVDNGQVVMVSKGKSGDILREVLTGDWADWIDYWAVDFDYLSQPEILRVINDGVEEQVRTGRHIFENQWQSFRTKQNRELELISAPHQYPESGTFMVGVKVIDIFGNDTTRVLPVQVKR